MSWFAVSSALVLVTSGFWRCYVPSNPWASRRSSKLWERWASALPAPRNRKSSRNASLSEMPRTPSCNWNVENTEIHGIIIFTVSKGLRCLLSRNSTTSAFATRSNHMASHKNSTAWPATKQDHERDKANGCCFQLRIAWQGWPIERKRWWDLKSHGMNHHKICFTYPP